MVTGALDIPLDFVLLKGLLFESFDDTSGWVSYAVDGIHLVKQKLYEIILFFLRFESNVNISVYKCQI